MRTKLFKFDLLTFLLIISIILCCFNYSLLLNAFATSSLFSFIFMIIAAAIFNYWVVIDKDAKIKILSEELAAEKALSQHRLYENERMRKQESIVRQDAAVDEYQARNDKINLIVRENLELKSLEELDEVFKTTQNNAANLKPELFIAPLAVNPNELDTANMLKNAISTITKKVEEPKNTPTNDGSI